jgi:23S rRNA (cytidine1920-2'-O)/16S rRNA (cytidine1409-2'-O)-methyltransferase
MAAENKQRLDATLVERGSFPSRARAQAAIRAGCVRVDGEIVRKTSLAIGDETSIVVEGDAHDYVSRGGVKLEAALGAFSMEIADKICLDLGASTGGFSDALLRRGARKIYAVDVGQGQLHERIGRDPRVVSLERTHARDLSRLLVPDPIEVIVCDVSFISLKKALPPALALAAPEARAVALIKPQFEVGPMRVGKGGLVRSRDALDAAKDIEDWFGRLDGWSVIGLIESPIAGGDGNREYLIGAARQP